MKRWLEATYGDSDITFEKNKGNLTLSNLSLTLRRKRGIYLMIADNPTRFGASGHITLWIGSELGCVIGGQSAKSVHFWGLFL